jgi:hypothetical protein
MARYPSVEVGSVQLVVGGPSDPIGCGFTIGPPGRAAWVTLIWRTDVEAEEARDAMMDAVDSATLLAAVTPGP